MAHSLETKARVIAAIFRGDTWDEVCRKHGISRKTLKTWLDAATNRPTPAAIDETKALNFDVALKDFLGATINMLHAWATTCSDPKFIRDNPGGVNELGSTVLDRADKLVRLLGGKPEGDEPN